MGGADTLPQLKQNCHQTSSSHHHTHGDRGAERRSCPFPEGSLVEVRTREADFKDTFFSATVIPPEAISPQKGSRRKSRRVSVEYHSLYKDEDGSELLKENVSISCVRPFPALQEIVEGYEVNDAVDAFYQEGWWIGSVAQVLEGEEKRYVVSFRNPPDELQFGFSEIRIHWDWVNGSWVRPERQCIARFMFDVGRKVEVSFHRKDCQVAWFPATINQDLGNGSYLVEYRSAISDEEVQTAKVDDDSLHLRPCPPLLKVNNFVILEKVDALFDFGWWSGVINKVLEHSRYMVFFKPMNMEREFQQSELRSHMDWKNGKWFTSSQSSQDVTIPSSDGGTHESHTCENTSVSVPTVPVKNLDGKDTFDGKTSSSLTSGNGHVGQLTPDSGKASHVKSLTKRRRQHLSDSGNGHVGQLTPDSQKASHVTSLTKRRRQHLSDSRNALSLSVKKFKGRTVLRTNQQEIDDMRIKEMLSDSVSPVSANNGESTGKQSATGVYSFDNPSWGKRTQRGQRDFGGKINLTPSYMKNSSAQMTQVENLELDAGGKDPDVVDKTAEDVRKERTEQGIVVPVIIGLPCAEMVNSGFGNSGGKRSRGSNSKENVNTVIQEKKQSHDSVIQTIEDIKLLELGESHERRKRGRPRKTMTESIQTLVTDDLNKKDDAPDETPEVVAVGMDTSSPIQEMTLNKEKPTNGQSDPKDRIGTMTKRTSPRKHGEKIVKVSVGPEESRVFNRGIRQNTGETVALQVPDFHGASGGELVEVNNSTLEVHIVLCDTETTSNEFENQPLSNWIIGRHSPSLVDGSKSAVVAAEQCKENGDKQINKVVLEEVSAEHQECENQSLPFVKNNAFIWKTIESMEVFQKTPQNPHFLPLEHCKESLREGKAIALMVNFSCMVEKTSKLQWDDPKSVADDILEIVAELEEHGFNVGGVRDRAAEFIAAKDREEKLVDEVKGLNEEILDEKCKKDKIEEEMKEINQQIRKLQEKLSVLEPAKETEEDIIVSLEARLKESEEVIDILRRAFEGDQGIVSSTLS
ncbi:hypothetical protein OROMI_030279 [Orobanche minor]